MRSSRSMTRRSRSRGVSRSLHRSLQKRDNAPVHVLAANVAREAACLLGSERLERAGPELRDSDGPSPEQPAPQHGHVLARQEGRLLPTSPGDAGAPRGVSGGLPLGEPRAELVESPRPARFTLCGAAEPHSKGHDTGGSRRPRRRRNNRRTGTRGLAPCTRFRSDWASHPTRGTRTWGEYGIAPRPARRVGQRDRHRGPCTSSCSRPRSTGRPGRKRPPGAGFRLVAKATRRCSSLRRRIVRGERRSPSRRWSRARRESRRTRRAPATR